MKLRELKNSDAGRMLDWLHCDDINFWFRFDGAEKTLSDAVAYIEKARCEENARHFAVTDDSDEYLGTVSLKDINIKDRAAEYAIVMHPDVVGRGAARFATDAVLDVAFNELDLNRVYLNVLQENIRAWKFYEKYGFTYEGTFRQAVMHRGQLKNLKWYSMLKEENDARRLR